MITVRKGLVAGNFDVIHPGYVRLFETINNNCHQQYILLHEDPTIERPHKKKPLLTLEEREEMLRPFFSNPVFLSYNLEAELITLLRAIRPDVRFLGDDYIDKEYTGDDLGIRTHFVNRDHGWSTTKYKEAIAKSI